MQNDTLEWFEDFNEGNTFAYRVPGLTRSEIIEFAARYDPQRFHLDEQAAKQTHFGGLVASGFQTQLHCFRPLCERVLKHTRAIGAPGIDQLRWLRPLYPGETLDVTVAVVSKRRSSKREDRGYIGLELHAEASGAPTFAMQWVFMILTRQGAQPGGNPVTG